MSFSLLFAVLAAAEVTAKPEVPLKFYPSYAVPYDTSPGETAKLDPAPLRKPGRFWMFVEKARQIEFTLRREADAGFQIDKSVPQMQFNFIQVECKGEHRRRWIAPGATDVTYRWDSQNPGFYTLDFDPGAHCAIIPVSANVPFALETEDGFAHLAKGKGWRIDRRPVAEFDAAAAKVKFDKPVNILYIGDSLTDFERGSNHVDTIAEYLDRHNPGKVKCWNYAKGGDCIKYVIERLDGKGKGEWQARYDGLWDRTYDVAFVLLGHNDTKTNLSNDFKIPFVTRERQHECYDDLIGRLRKHGTKRIVLMSSTSSNFDICSERMNRHLERARQEGKGLSLFGEPAQMEAFNSALREIAARNKVEYMDIYEKMKARKDKPFMVRFTDGVHLTKRGYDYVALETLRYLADHPAPPAAAPSARIPARPAATAASPSHCRNEEKPMDFEELKYNRKGGEAYLDAGVWSQPLVMDYDNDGDLDLVVLTKSALTNAFILYENPTPKGVACKMPVFKKGRTISTNVCNGHVSSHMFDGKPIVVKPGGVMWDPIGEWGRFTPVNGVDYDPLMRDTKKAEKGNYRVWRLVDFDGDGLEDIVIGLDSWTRYGVLEGNAYNDKGVWTNDLLHSHLYLGRCVSGRGRDARFARAEEVFLADGKPFETDGDPCPMLEDFDGDGDLDIVCGDFTGGFWYFENAGTRKNPSYAPRRRLKDPAGREVRCEVCMQVPLSVDWDADGDPDIIEGEEDGRVAFIENLGMKGGEVRFSQPQYFRQEADDLDFGCLTCPFGCDWDGDGDWDLVCGNSAGRLAFIENRSGPGVFPPEWAEPVLMSAGGETINIRAGDNGSIQGPAERSWGYTVPSVADWDGDGFLDVMMNDIWGHVRLYRNPGRKGTLDLEKPVPVEVEWEGGTPELAWGWERPAGREILGPWRTRALMHDWNRDGLADLIMLDHEGVLAYFERFRDRSGMLKLKHPRRAFFRDDLSKPCVWGSTIPRRSGRRQFCIADWTRDGKEDILLNGGNVQLYRQLREEGGKWIFSMGGGLGKRKLAGHATCPTVVDFDGDGIPEAVAGAEDGRFFYHANPPR